MPGLEDDKAAILALIRRNLAGLWTRDYELWASCFVHESYQLKWGWWQGGGIYSRAGWDENAERFRRDMPPAMPEFVHGIRIVGLDLQVRGDVAWAHFEQHFPVHNVPGHIGPGIKFEFRVFERLDGEWKIAVVATLDPDAGQGGEGLLRLAPDGGVLWASAAGCKALTEDDELVVRGRRLRFRHGALDRRLRDAIEWARARGTGYVPVRGAIPIVADAGEGLPARVYWVIAEAGMIFFSIGAHGLNSDRLTQAALTYGLSRSQMQVAGCVAEGLTLNEIAARMGITANTARTHLDRIYEKTGVRTQPALVRVLLSAAPPI